MSLAESTPDQTVVPHDWNRFPVNTLLADGGMQRLFPKLLWLVAPFAYYYATKSTGAFNPDSFISTAAYIVLLVISMTVVGGVIATALPPRGRGGYYDKARGLIATLLGIWAMALGLECLSYSLTGVFDPDTPANVVSDLWCAVSSCTGLWAVVVAGLSHLTYALVGAVLLAALVHVISRFIPTPRPKLKFEPVPEPNLFLAVILVGLLMWVFDAVITYVN